MDDAHEINMLVAKVRNGRDWLAKELELLDKVEHVYPSDANFLLVKVREAGSIFTALVEQQIIVRDRSQVTLCEGCLRITVGTEEENQRLIEALKMIDK
jgi:histidinol-phosphate aminotransferase